MKTETLKKMVYMVIGYVTTNPDKLREMATEMAASGKISEAEGHAFVDEVMSGISTLKTEVDKKTSQVTTGIVERLNLADSPRLTALGKRIEALDKKRIELMTSGFGNGEGKGKGKSRAKKSKAVSKSKSGVGKKEKPVARKKAAVKSVAKKSSTKK